MPARAISKFNCDNAYLDEMAQSKYLEDDVPNLFDFPKAFINFHKEAD